MNSVVIYTDGACKGNPGPGGWGVWLKSGPSEKELCGAHGKDCDGNCGNPACHCPTNCTNFTIPFFDGFLGIKSIVSKPNFYYQDTYYSSGFLSIWQPPKIG